MMNKKPQASDPEEGRQAARADRQCSDKLIHLLLSQTESAQNKIDLKEDSPCHLHPHLHSQLLDRLVILLKTWRAYSLAH